MSSSTTELAEMDIDNLPWPQCLGTFDEESCRFYLHDIGTRIVPFYPFAIGMEEVHASILEKFGLEGSADVISVIRELLEDEQNADGIGDDGDVWRSWRHSWRHRNDDKLNPFIPRVGSQFLPVATPIRIRKYRAANFVSQHNFLLSEGQTSMSCDPLNDGDRIDEGDFSSSAEDIGPALRFSMQVSEPLNRFTSSTTAIRGGELIPAKNSNTSRGRASSNMIPNKHFKPSQGQNAFLIDAVALQERNEDRAYGEICMGQKTEEALADLDAQPVSAISEVVMTTKSRLSNSLNTPQTKKRSSNRHARLIDGTISTFASTEVNQTDLLHNSKTEPLRNQLQPSVQTASDNRNVPETRSRNTWLGLKRVLRNPQSSIKNVRSARSLSVSILSGITSAKSAEGMVHTKASIAHPPSPHTPRGRKMSCVPEFDGAADRMIYESSPRLDLNKPLPLNPDDAVRSSQSDTGIVSRAASQIFSSSLSTTSSSPFLKASKKFSTSSFTSDGIVQTPNTHPDLSPVNEARHEAPVGGGSSKTSNFSVPLGPSRANSVHTTMIDEHNMPLSQIPPLPSPLGNVDGANDDSLRRYLPSSQSEPSLQSKTVNGTRYTNNKPSKTSSISNKHQSKDLENSGNHDLLRGNTENPPNTTPIKRSRSPFKRLLGFGKSEATHVVEAQEKKPHAKTLPVGSAKKKSVQKWGDRLRYGFLTADEEEQLRQEQNIEQYMTEFESVPLSTHNAEVSLEPPQQAKVQAELELMIAVTANRYLLGETMAGRLAVETIIKVKDQWNGLGRHRVTNFHYDLSTQHYLIMLNLRTVKFRGPAATDPIQINAILHGWKMLAKSLTVRSLCNPDSVIRKHLHDGRRVLELLGAPSITFTSFDDIQLKTLARISANQSEGRLHAGNRNFSMRSRRTLSDVTDFPYTARSFQIDYINLGPSPPASPASTRASLATATSVPPVPTITATPQALPTPNPQSTPRRPTGADGALVYPPSPTQQLSMKRVRPYSRHIPITMSPGTSDEYDNSRGGRLGKAIREKPEDVLLGRGGQL